jgi:hypothetical protein
MKVMKKVIPAGVRVASVLSWALGSSTLAVVMLIGGVGNITTIFESIWTVLWASSVFFLAAGYGLWQSRKWAAILALVLIAFSFISYGHYFSTSSMSSMAFLKELRVYITLWVLLGVLVLYYWKHYK